MEQQSEPGASRQLQPAPSPHTLLTHDANEHLHHQYYQDQNHDRHSLATPQTPSQHQSPRFSSLTPAPQGHTFQQSYVPQDRSLPDRNVTEDNITDAYIAFILYCNPCFPLSVDTSKLKEKFNETPASEGMRPNIFKLYELVKRHEAKEEGYEHWTQIVQLLGVKAADTEKKQSHQRVSQYGVRLKRWLKQRHIDAFFGYLGGNELGYSRQIPRPNDAYPESRDGLFVFEDLALQALDPTLVPKRGRKRADELDDDLEPASAIEPKRPHLDTSVFGSRGNTYHPSAYPSSAPVPISAHPDGLDGYPHGDPWSAITTGQHSRSALMASQQQIRWARNETPSTPHPSMTPMSAHAEHYFDEPRSAVTPSTSRKRGRKHGPVTSSAWTSTNTTANGKLRGRPPSNRSVRDGSFGTFPADPKVKEAPTIDLSRNHISTGTPTPGTTESPKPQFLAPQQPTPISATTPHSLALLQNRPAPHLQARPERLQVQVPENRGGPVSLITPTLLVNGRLNESPSTQDNQHAPGSLQTPALSTASTARTMTSTSSFFSNGNESAVTDMDDQYDGRDGHHFLPSRTSPMAHKEKDLPVTKTLTDEDVKRALAAELLQAELSGRSKHLRGQEAKDLAQAIIQRSSHSQSDNAGRQVHDASTPREHTEHLRALSTWLGLTASLGLHSPLITPPPTGGNKRVKVRRFKVKDDGYDSPIDDDSDDQAGESALPSNQIRESFDVEWSAPLGGIVGQFSVKGLLLSKLRDEDGSTATSDNTEIDARSGGDFWKERYLLSEKRLRELHDENRALRDNILAAVL
ncbi:hypothetical protein FKW77_005452 [Venturia effusa]|uniref:Uncharacterized protein n=1 Tax=Venturia effusa TaxID=50376 RepID=A0A517LMT8_9PEZI|nr:hypothetical protein FKW77_005452 [Venturia effusa]